MEEGPIADPYTALGRMLAADRDEWLDGEMRAVVYYLRGNRHLVMPPWLRELFSDCAP